MQIIPYQVPYFNALVKFIARLNANPVHHIGFFGTHPAEIEHTLQELEPPLEAGFLLALDGDRLAGVLGLELDLELGRAWIYGPLIESPQWHTLADQMYTQVRALIPPEIKRYDIFCEAQNLNCQQFAERHLYQKTGEHSIWTLPRSGISSIPAASADHWDPMFFNQFDALHQQAFPNAYYTARQIIDKLDEHTCLLIDVWQDHLRGYIFVKVDLDAGEGYIDFIGVDAACRRQGIGRSLLAAAIHWMFSFPSVEKVTLTVAAANTSAIRLYDSLGFLCEKTMCAYRTQLG